jgi:hypothetical protein
MKRFYKINLLLPLHYDSRCKEDEADLNWPCALGCYEYATVMTSPRKSRRHRPVTRNMYCGNLFGVPDLLVSVPNLRTFPSPQLMKN